MESAGMKGLRRYRLSSLIIQENLLKKLKRWTSIKLLQYLILNECLIKEDLGLISNIFTSDYHQFLCQKQKQAQKRLNRLKTNIKRKHWQKKKRKTNEKLQPNMENKAYWKF